MEILATIALFGLSSAYERINEKVTFANSNAKCQQAYGTDLASIHSDNDFESAINVCGTAGPCWLGASTTTTNPSTNWQWIDGSAWDYENWGSFAHVPQGQGRTSEYNACIWGVWHKENAPGVNDCGNVEQYYPICNSPIEITSVSRRIYGVEDLQCPDGFSALSCGISTGLGVSVAGQYEKYWSSYPDENGAVLKCEGSDYYGGDLHAVCGKGVGNLMISAQYLVAGDVHCPDNYVVSGCGVRANNPGGGNWEVFKQVYPNSDGKSCHCYNYFGATCYATCIAKEKVNTIIKSQEFNAGMQKVTCDGSYQALGCGIMLKPHQGYEVYPKYFVDPNDSKSCVGYSYYPFNLYAICGQFQ